MTTCRLYVASIDCLVLEQDMSLSGSTQSAEPSGIGVVVDRAPFALPLPVWLVVAVLELALYGLCSES